MARSIWQWAATPQSYRLLVRALVALQVVGIVLTVWSAVDTHHLNLNSFVMLPVTLGLVQGKGWALRLTRFMSMFGLIVLPCLLLLKSVGPSADAYVFGWSLNNTSLLTVLLAPWIILHLWTIRAIKAQQSRIETTSAHYGAEPAHI